MRLGEIDIVQRLPGLPGCAELAARAIVVTAFGLQLRVASRADLVAMKRAGGRAIDLADLERLEEAPEQDTGLIRRPPNGYLPPR